MNPAQIIEQLGGRPAVASLTGAKPNAITQWRRDGVPPKYWHVLVAEARRLGATNITFDALRDAKPRTEPRPSAPANRTTGVIESEQPSVEGKAA